MTDQHPVTPPPELVQQWFDAWESGESEELSFANFVIPRAAQWGADCELDACIDWMTRMGYWGDDGKAIPALRAARRPKSPSLKGQALEILDAAEFRLTAAEYNIILRALEQIDD